MKKNIIIAPIKQGNAPKDVREFIGYKGELDNYNIIQDWGDNFGKTLYSPQNALCVAIHGNRGVYDMKPRFEYLDTICDNVWCVIGSPIPEYVIYDRDGYSGVRDIATNHDLLKIDEVHPADAFTTHNLLFDKYVKANRSKYSQPSLKQFKHEPFILALGQVAGDSQIDFSNFAAPKKMVKGNRPAEERPCAHAAYINTWISAFSILDKLDIPIIYKPHPLEFQDPNAVINGLIENKVFKNVSIISNVSLHELLAESKAAITINSGTGFEALLHLKPVVTLGKSDYSAATYECKTFEDLRNVEKFIHKPVDKLRVKKFLHAYLQQTWHLNREENGYPLLIKSLMPQKRGNF